jgi:hypothetical protein
MDNLCQEAQFQGTHVTLQKSERWSWDGRHVGARDDLQTVHTFKCVEVVVAVAYADNSSPLLAQLLSGEGLPFSGRLDLFQTRITSFTKNVFTFVFRTIYSLKHIYR